MPEPTITVLPDEYDMSSGLGRWFRMCQLGEGGFAMVHQVMDMQVFYKTGEQLCYALKMIKGELKEVNRLDYGARAMIM